MKHLCPASKGRVISKAIGAIPLASSWSQRTSVRMLKYDYLHFRLAKQGHKKGRHERNQSNLT